MPDWYNGVYEMEELLKAEGDILDNEDNKYVRVLLNEFVIQADEKGISVFEDQLGIYPAPTDTLEQRRNNVLLHMLPPQPLTIRFLRKLFKLMNLEVNVEVVYGERRAITSGKALDIDRNKLKSVKYLLNIALPANMGYQIIIYLTPVDITNHAYFGTVSVVNSHVKSLVNYDQLDLRPIVRDEIFVAFGHNQIIDTSVQANTEQFKKKE